MVAMLTSPYDGKPPKSNSDEQLDNGTFPKLNQLQERMGCSYELIRNYLQDILLAENNDRGQWQCI